MADALPDGFYWTKLNETSEWEPAKLDGDQWQMIGDGFETYPTDKLHSIGPRVGYESSLAVVQADFLCRRLDELDWSQDKEGVANDFMGHVEPAAARLRNTLDIAEKGGPVAREPLTDVRQLMYVQQMIVNAVIPIADAEPVDGDFTMKLTLRRKDGKSLADVNLSIPARQARR